MIVLFIVSVICVLGIAYLFCWQLNKHFIRLYDLMDKHANERQEMLDRIMARNFAQYKQAEILTKQMGSVAAQAMVTPPTEEDDISDVGM